MTSPFRKMVLKSSLLIFIAMLLSRVFGYLFNALFAKSFTPAEYGLFVYLFSASMFIAGIGLLGIDSAVARFIPYSLGGGGERKTRDYLKTGIVLTCSLMVFCLICLIVVSIYTTLLSPLSLLFISVALIIHSIGFFMASVVSGFKKPEISNISVALGQFAKFALLLVVVYFSLGFSWALISFLIAFGLGYIPVSLYAWRNYGFGGSFRWDRAKELIGFGVFTVFTYTASNLLSWASIFFIQYFTGYSLVAIFNVAFLISTAALLLFLSITEIYGPVVTELLGCRDHVKCSRLSSYLLESFFLLFLPLFIVGFILSGEILLVFFTPVYVQADLTLKILLLSSFILGISTLFRRFIVADGRPNVDTGIIIVCSLVNVVLNYVLIPLYSINGAAVASLASSVVMLLLSLKYLGPKIEITFSAARLAKILLAASASFLVTYLVKMFIQSPIISLLILSSVFCLLYALIIFLAKALRSEDVEMVEMISAKVPLSEGRKKSLMRLLQQGVST